MLHCFEKANRIHYRKKKKYLLLAMSTEWALSDAHDTCNKLSWFCKLDADLVGDKPLRHGEQVASRQSTWRLPRILPNHYGP